jgi:hypothetical protein
MSGPTALNVDEERGIIFGVKILGTESTNTHGMNGATKGSRYTKAALQAAKPLYEAALSNKNHWRKSKEDRPAEDRIGWFENVQAMDDGLFGDYHVLLSDPLTPKLLESAKRNPRLFAMSHDAFGSGKVIDGWFIIDAIPEVNSIDVVADGGTNVSLFESRKRRNRAMKFRTLLESSTNPDVKKWFGKSHITRLLEMDGLGDSVLPDAPAEADVPAMTWKDHIGELLKALASDESLSAEDMRKKAMAALKLLDEGDGGDTTTKVDESDDDADEMDDDEKKKKTQESKRKKAKNANAYESTLQLCESLQFNPNPTQLRNLAKQPDDEARTWLIGELRNAKTESKTPQSAPAGTRIQESKKAGAAAVNEPFVPMLRR